MPIKTRLLLTRFDIKKKRKKGKKVAIKTSPERMKDKVNKFGIMNERASERAKGLKWRETRPVRVFRMDSRMCGMNVLMQILVS